LRFRTRPASAATFRGMPTFESKTQRALQNCPSRKPRKRPALPLQRAPRNLLGNLVTPASLRAATTHRGDPRWPGLKRSMQCCEAMFDEETFGISPWMRGAPQSGFSGLIFRISFRISLDTRGRPGWPRRTFHVQNRRNPLRCQANHGFGLYDAKG
jgi:hypothetical protein